ncbi:MAG TPA: carboxypeptidase-like regulatory domain-containing protein [Bacteroidales bacterium]|nr:carboxypeptidase-like regulatory domain-containing protein [Bacteroidales bacterium]
MNKKFFSVFLIIISIWSCEKKPEDITFTGVVKDQFSGTPVSDVNVKLQAQVLQDNVFSTAYQTIASATTNQQGEFQIIYEKNIYDEFRLLLTKEGYFYKIINLGTTLENNHTYSISGKGYIKLHIKNINPTNGDEYISIAWIVPNDAYFYCSTIFPYSSNNNNVDTSFVIDVSAYASYVLIANWKHDTSISTFTDTIIPLFIDTTYYDLLY